MLLPSPIQGSGSTFGVVEFFPCFSLFLLGLCEVKKHIGSTGMVHLLFNSPLKNQLDVGKYTIHTWNKNSQSR